MQLSPKIEMRTFTRAMWCAFSLGTLHAENEREAGIIPTDSVVFESQVKPFLTKYCVSCHGEKKQKAKFFLHDIDGIISNGKDAERWTKIHELISIRDMPPPEEDELPGGKEREEIVRWMETEMAKINLGVDDTDRQRPEYANRVNHGELFSGDYIGPAYSRSRLWRISPDIYNAFSRNVHNINQGTNTSKGDPNREVYSQPFSMTKSGTASSYDTLLADEGTLSVLMQNTRVAADLIVKGQRRQVRTRRKSGGEKDKVDPNAPVVYEYQSIRGRFQRLQGEKGLFTTFSAADGEPSEDELEEIFNAAFSAIMLRPASDEERAQYCDRLFREMVKTGGRERGLKYLVMGLMLSPEFVFRSELGTGEMTKDGRRMLGPWELAYAISYTLRDKGPDKELVAAVDEGKLQSKEDVEREVRRLLSEGEDDRFWGYHNHRSEFEQIRILRFFQEYFGYLKAADVFKEMQFHSEHRPKQHIKDADLMVLHVLKEDRKVLETLLTSDRYFIGYIGDEEKVKKNRDQFFERKGNSKRPGPPTELFKKISKLGYTPWPNLQGNSRYMTTYGIDREATDFPMIQPFAVEHRSGMLTHPAWLVAHSLNFESDPVRRGKWIAERLLCDVVPEIPIGVDAKVPEDHTLTLRDRFSQVVEEEQCWRCHKKMNPYGNAFEVYDDFGRFRIEEITDSRERKLEYLQELKEYEREMVTAKKRKRAFHGEKPTLHLKPVEASTVVIHSPDPELNGSYRNVDEMMARFSRSPRVRQSFLRHMFRNFMGRNETLVDSPTLIAMDKSYLESGGSFRETLVTLMTSDSFLYRK